MCVCVCECVCVGNPILLKASRFIFFQFLLCLSVSQFFPSLKENHSFFPSSSYSSSSTSGFSLNFAMSASKSLTYLRSFWRKVPSDLELFFERFFLPSRSSHISVRKVSTSTRH